MIEMPRRSVTRFFIPLIDVLTLLFCIYLLMPIIKPREEGEGDTPAETPLTAAERQELRQLRAQQKTVAELERMQRELKSLQEQLAKLRLENLDTLQKRLAIRVLEIGADGKLYYYDARRSQDRRTEVTANNVAALIRNQKQQAGGNELYFLILYPRITSGFPVFPLRSQREEYDHWFAGVAHGYDIPIQGER